MIHNGRIQDSPYVCKTFFIICQVKTENLSKLTILHSEDVNGGTQESGKCEYFTISSKQSRQSLITATSVVVFEISHKATMHSVLWFSGMTEKLNLMILDISASNSALTVGFCWSISFPSQVSITLPTSY